MTKVSIENSRFTTNSAHDGYEIYIEGEDADISSNTQYNFIRLKVKMLIHFLSLQTIILITILTLVIVLILIES